MHRMLHVCLWVLLFIIVNYPRKCPGLDSWMNLNLDAISYIINSDQIVKSSTIASTLWKQEIQFYGIASKPNLSSVDKPTVRHNL